MSPTAFATFLLLLAVILTCVHSAALPDRMPRSFRQKNLNGVGLQKRPFCNAFTGCGRKRSGPAMEQQDERTPELAGRDTEDSLGTLLDLSAEPAVEDLSRQIMSEAKLWEAIQEASMELQRRKEGQRLDDRFPVAFSAQ